MFSPVPLAFQPGSPSRHGAQSRISRRSEKPSLNGSFHDLKYAKLSTVPTARRPRIPSSLYLSKNPSLSPTSGAREATFYPPSPLTVKPFLSENYPALVRAGKRKSRRGVTPKI